MCLTSLRANRTLGPMTTSRELLDLVSEFITAQAEGGTADDLQSIAQRFDVALTDVVIDRASVQNEG
jgi:hypothetical protein